MSLIDQWMAKIDSVIAAGPFASSWDSLREFQIPTWYQNGKFGIFIHWGAYSVPAFGSEWYPRNMYKRGTKEFEHHLRTYGPHDQFGYKDFIPLFKAEKFDAAAWAALFKEAGAKFVVPVAEHHDGFPMYDCGLTQWSAARLGPRRDVIGQLAAAVRDAGMVLGLSSHRAEHWWFFDEGRKYESDVNDVRYAGLYAPAQARIEGRDQERRHGGPDETFLRDWLARTCEMVDKYRPQLVYFDWWIRNLNFEPYLRKFAAFYYNRGAEWEMPVAIDAKLDSFPPGTAVLDIERGQLKDIRPQLWQNDTSVSKTSWGYVNNHEYKDATGIIHDLIDVVSKNGALLLNIGPKHDGTIPGPEADILRQIGRFLDKNGEAIYGSGPWVKFGEGPTEVAEGSFTDTRRGAFTHQDVRFTTRGHTLYALVLGKPPGDKVVIRSLGEAAKLLDRRIGAVSLVGDESPLRFVREASGLAVQLPAAMPFEHAIVLKISTSD
jgi:alpha-L-fucosidase